MPEVTPFQVLIVDDHPLMRRGIRQLLELDPAFHVVAEAGDGASAIDLANRIEPDLILLDLNMKGLSGLDTLNALRRDGVTAQIIILTVSDSASDIYALIDAGADGYLLKDSDPEVLLEAIRKGANGGKVFSDRVNEYLRERERFGAQEDPFSILTERELDVLHELAQGLSNKQIASVLNISEQTVKVHIRNLLRKLNVRSRIAATI
ncbi:nitrate/nitrite response regulator protein NarP, partial [Salmonella enterica]|nr:nitrate/nitrite response regulator protein NarP [Salmonella enterica]